MKYFIYTRKSTDSEERQILSIEAQLAELKEFAAKEKLEIVASLCEAQTAKEPGRKIFGEMLDRICAGEASGILAWHPDRLARNSIDGGKIIYLLDTEKILDLKFPTFWFDSTPQGKFMLNIAFGQSKYYIDNLSENIKRGHRQKLRKGIWPGFAPLGYLNNHKTKAIDTNKEKAPVIRKCFELYATGEYTLKSIKQFLADTRIDSYKGNVLSCSCVQRILKNPFYYGVFKFNDEIYQGTHEPIISKKLFDSVQQVMNNRGKKKRKRKHEFAFSGLMRCGSCGCLITAETQKGHNYYRCTKKKQACNEKYLREENLVEQMKSFIQKVSLPDDWAENMLAEIDKEKEQAKLESLSFVQNLQKERLEVEQKMDKLLDLFIEGKGISPEEYQAKKSKLLNEKLEIEQKIRDFEQKGNNWLEPMKEMILASSQAKILLSQSDNQQIRSFLKNVGSNFILARSGLFLFLLLKFIFFDSIKMKANTILILCYQNFEDMASNKNTIGNNVKKLRAKLDLTQDDLARKSGVKYTTLSKIESGVVTKPTVHIIAKIAKALDVSIEDLLR
jgi:DNA invertase Pin-like site-specific DNA recombinase/DNA-binding XRE family transcriptional regulator